MSAKSGHYAKGKKTPKKPSNMTNEIPIAKEKNLEDNGLPSEVTITPSKPPEGFLTFNHTIITPEMMEHAAKNLNETEETRRKGLEEMRAIIRSDPDLHIRDDDDFLLVFLRSRKFDPKRSAELLKTGLHYIDTYHYLLNRDDQEVLERVIKANMIGFLQYRDRKGRALIYSRADKWNPDEISAADAIFGGVVAVQSAGLNQVNQVNGYLVILDLKGVTWQQFFAMSRWMIFGTITLQRACPCFMKAFHVINLPSFYKLGWKLVKPLLSEKIRNRFIFHKSSDLTSLYEHIPQEILPPELGGPIPFSNDHWATDIAGIWKEYQEQLNSNYCISKRKKTSRD